MFGWVFVCCLVEWVFVWMSVCCLFGWVGELFVGMGESLFRCVAVGLFILFVWMSGCWFVCSDGWMGRWVQGWKNGKMDRWISEYWMDGRMDGWADGHMDRWTAV